LNNAKHKVQDYDL